MRGNVGVNIISLNNRKHRSKGKTTSVLPSHKIVQFNNIRDVLIPTAIIRYKTISGRINYTFSIIVNG